MREWKRSALAALALFRAGEWGRLAARTGEIVLGRRFALPAALPPAPRPPGAWQAAARLNDVRPHLLMIGPSFGRDGAPLSQFELASGLAARGWRVTAAAAEDGPLRARYAAAGIESDIWPALALRTAALSFYEHDITALSKRIAVVAPTLVYANTVDTHGAIDAARLLGIPSVWNIRETEFWRSRLADRCHGVAARALACFSYPAAVICVAKATAAAWSRFTPPDRLHVIYNAPAKPAARSDYSDRASTRDIVAIGRICERKRQGDILDAFSRLPDDIRQGRRLIFVGGASGRYARRLMRDARRFGGQIEFLGEIGEDDVTSVLLRARLFVHAASAEAFPRVLIEAASCGVPIIASNVGGAAERLRDGESAILFDAGDIGSLTGAMTRLLGEDSVSRRIAAGARRALIEEWSYDDMIGAYEALFRAAHQEKAQ